MPPTAFLIQWVITWVILAVVFWFAAEWIQRYLYETAVERIGWRVLAVTPVLAAVLVKWPLPFENLFFNLGITLAQAVLWFLACWLALRFQWQHAAAAGLIAVVTIAPVTSSSVDSLMQKRAAAATSGQTKPAAAPASGDATNPTGATAGGASPGAQGSAPVTK